MVTNYVVSTMVKMEKAALLLILALRSMFHNTRGKSDPILHYLIMRSIVRFGRKVHRRDRSQLLLQKDLKVVDEVEAAVEKAVNP